MAQDFIDDDAPDLAAGADTLGAHLGTYLAFSGHYSDLLGELVNTLCRRIGEADARAPMELWRLLQGLHFGGALATESLEKIGDQLSDLWPQWRSL
ncbi:hypothetical protein [Pseudomonas sp. MWU12-2345]|uniref:hypothetical protein n=1 Tax=Pseudomonas sp. MWU12-2345 TaxID=2928689 RepID=UPI00200E8F53|nr:hypothetical protein [Pseudomonas sp. MWU12-2345]